MNGYRTENSIGGGSTWVAGRSGNCSRGWGINNSRQNIFYNPSVDNELIATEVNGELLHLRKDFNQMLNRINTTTDKCNKMEKDIKEIGANINIIMKMLTKKNQQ